MAKNVTTIKNCFGCGVCATICPKKIISMELNADGFYEPCIEHEDRCIDCGLCLDVCAFCHDDLSMKPKEEDVHSYAAWSRTKSVQLKCSSGGVGFEIGKSLIDRGYKVCGVRYNADAARAEHYIATDAAELAQSMGSKYIQSYTVDGFSAINVKERYLVTGTPCQIDSFRRYIRRRKIEDRFVLLDFFCHCVPSMTAWQYYLQLAGKQVGQVSEASWRSKQTGWHDSWNMCLKGDKGEMSSRMSQGDLFYYFFLGGFCSNPACEKNCKYKYRSSSADIRIGDLWGDTYKDNEDGVSALVAFTSKGQEVIQNLDDCELTELPFEVVAQGQMTKNADSAPLAKVMMCCLKMNMPKVIIRGVIFASKAIGKLRRILGIKK